MELFNTKYSDNNLQYFDNYELVYYLQVGTMTMNNKKETTHT